MDQTSDNSRTLWPFGCAGTVVSVVVAFVAEEDDVWVSLIEEDGVDVVWGTLPSSAAPLAAAIAAGEGSTAASRRGFFITGFDADIFSVDMY